MSTQLSLRRPRRFSDLIGEANQKLAKKIRGHMKKRVPKAFQFNGTRGVGKTSIAWVVAVSAQCKHQKKFGEPCKKCWSKREKSFPIYDQNCADKTGIDDLRAFIRTHSEYTLLGEGRRPVIILDEVHKLSDSSQNFLLKHLEKKNNPTLFILNTTRPMDVLDTIRRRCLCYNVKPLRTDEIEQLVSKLLKEEHSKLDRTELSDALIEKGVTSPGLICQAVEKYLAGNNPDEAADVDGGSTNIDTKALCRAVIKGEVSDIWRILSEAQDSDARGIRIGVTLYLKAMLLEMTEISDRTAVVADAIRRLCSVARSEDKVQMAGIAAELYFLAKMFQDYKF